MDVWKKRTQLTRQHKCRRPATYKHKDPILGLDAVYEAVQAGKSKNYLARQRTLHDRFGYTFSSRFLTTAVINTIEPENIKTVLQTNFQDYGIGDRRKTAFAPLLGKAIIQVDGKEWRHSRTRIRQVLTTNCVRDVTIFEKHVLRLIDSIPTNGSTINLKDLFFRLAADITTDLFFGNSIMSLKNQATSDRQFIHALHEAQTGCEERWRLGKVAALMPQSRFQYNVSTVHTYVDRYVERTLQFRKSYLEKPGPRAEIPRPGKDFLKELAKTAEDRRTLRDELLALFIAGSDTVAAVLTNLFFEIAREPKVWQRLRQEVEAVVEHTPTLQDIRTTPYVGKCINEGTFDTRDAIKHICK
ncbi:MAG: hypothetical protein Q9201_007743 [Fulgogasparrea decipioides]